MCCPVALPENLERTAYERLILRPITFFIATSADGMIARENGSTDWMSKDCFQHYKEFFKKVDTVLLGRKSFENILTRGPWPYTGKQSFVFSNSLKNDFGPEVQVIARDPVAFVEDLKESEGGRMWLIGGAELARTLMTHNMVDEVILDIHPHILGSGVHLFPLPLHSMFWELVDSKELASSLIRVQYRLKSSDISFD